MIFFVNSSLILYKQEVNYLATHIYNTIYQYIIPIISHFIHHLSKIRLTALK